MVIWKKKKGSRISSRRPVEFSKRFFRGARGNGNLNKKKWSRISSRRPVEFSKDFFEELVEMVIWKKKAPQYLGENRSNNVWLGKKRQDKKAFST